MPANDPDIDILLTILAILREQPCTKQQLRDTLNDRLDHPVSPYDLDQHITRLRNAQYITTRVESAPDSSRDLQIVYTTTDNAAAVLDQGATGRLARLFAQLF